MIRSRPIGNYFSYLFKHWVFLKSKSFLPDNAMNYRTLIILLLITVSVQLSTSAQTVYKTPSGKKYHLENCRMVKNVSEEISIRQAVELGLSPCSICHPPINNGVTNSTHKAQGTDKGVQCKGMTKAGTRCKHFTKIGNGYCFQHQPG